eukprot:COSAG04_NODE_90_length_26856_cov_18.273723_19_plen_67_part_00
MEPPQALTASSGGSAASQTEPAAGALTNRRELRPGMKLAPSRYGGRMVGLTDAQPPASWEQAQREV